MSEFDCARVLTLLYAFVDDELPAEDAALVRRHFEVCAPCVPALSYTHAYRAAVRRAADRQASAPASLHAAVLRALEAAREN